MKHNFKRSFTLMAQLLILMLSSIFITSCSEDEKPDIEEVDLILALSTVTKENSLHVKTGDTATLDASPVHCSDNSRPVYAWVLDGKPSSSVAVLENTDASITSVMADIDGDYHVTADIKCGAQLVSVSYVITSTAAANNAKPQAKASINTHTATPDALTPDLLPDNTVVPVVSQKVAMINTAPHAAIQSVHVAKTGDTIHLSGHLSDDADGDTLQYTWVITAVPSGSSATLLNADNADSSFIADLAGTYKVELTVNDGNADSTVSMLTVSVTDIPIPIASAGPDMSEQLGQSVTLHGSGSHDINNGTLTYAWQLNHHPSASKIVFATNTDESPQFTPDVEGTYVFKLIVNNGVSDSAADTVTITIKPVPAQVVHQDLYQDLLDLGLDSTDAHYLVDNHKAEATSVVANTNRLFKGVTITDSMFKDPTAAGASLFRSHNLTAAGWEARHITVFKKVFGRINFVVNSSKFKAAFDAQINLLNPAYQGIIPGNFESIAFPSSYDQFVSDGTAAIAKSNNIFQFYLSDNTTGTAWGAHEPGDKESALKLLVERVGMMGDAAGTTKPWEINQAAGLSFHELMHSLGYQHDGTSAETTLKPTNIPYFVQIIASYRSEDILAVYCGGAIAVCAPPHIVYGTPNALLTQYFGNK